MDENEAQKIRDEIQYWKHVLEDALAVNDSLHQAAEGSSELLLIGSEILFDDPQMTNRLMDILEKVQTPIAESQERLLALIQLTEGRLRMILSQVKDEDA